MPLTDNLAAYWKLDAAGLLVDATGTVTDLTNNGATPTAAGIINEGADFELGSLQSLSHASVAALQSGDVDFEIQAWVKLESEPAVAMIVAKDSSTATKREYQLWYQASDDRFHFRVWDANQTAVVVVANNFGAVPTGTLCFVHAWHDAAGDVIGISVNDGTADTQATGMALQAASDALFVIGGQDFVTIINNFDGVVDEVGLWKRVLTGAERTSLYNAGAGFAYPFSGVAAPDISYTTPVNVTVDVAIAIQSPTNAGGASTDWTVDSGSLPTGLSLNATTGAITGTPTVVETQTPTIKAANAGGSDTFQITFNIVVASTSGDSSSFRSSAVQGQGWQPQGWRNRTWG